MDTDKRAEAVTAPDDGLRAAVGHFLALDDAEEARIEGQVGPPAFESEWVKAREAMRAALATPAAEPGLREAYRRGWLEATSFGSEPGTTPAAEPGLDTDDCEAIIHALDLIPTWFPETRAKVVALAARLSGPASEEERR